MFTLNSFNIFDLYVIQIGSSAGYCGQLDPFSLTTSTKNVLIKMVTDFTREKRGFNATFVSKVQGVYNRPFPKPIAQSIYDTNENFKMAF